ncbi:hypothetical protein GOODEAATRI_032229 [Goodea atripinnis]|uniref:Uncharacterized protein n=1 Tax=Goodea atripinnis TaxID=208336 RepID=A0ABV0N614_9TELE
MNRTLPLIPSRHAALLPAPPSSRHVQSFRVPISIAVSNFGNGHRAWTASISPGEDTKDVDKHLRNKRRSARLEEVGRDGKPFGSWCQKLQQPGACFCHGRRPTLFGRSCD